MAKKIEIEWQSKDEAVARSLNRTVAALDNLNRRMDKAEAQSKQTTKTAETGWNKVGTSIVNAGKALVGGGSLLVGLDMIKTANREVIAGAEEAAKKYDELAKKFQITAGLNASQTKWAIDRQRIIANKNAVPLEVASAGAAALIGSGFDFSSASGQALDVLLTTQNAYAARGKAVDAESLAKAAASYMRSQGQEPSATGLSSLMKDAFALRSGSFELGDFAALGKEGATFAGMMSSREQLAAYGVLRDVMAPEEAATGLRSIVSNLSSASIRKPKREALARLGINPADVDLTGEDFGTVLDRLNAGLQNVPEAERDDLLTLLVEQAGVRSVNTLLRGRDKAYRGYLRGMETSGADYEKTSKPALMGQTAALIRQKNEQDRIAAENYDAGDTLLGALDIEAAEAGYGPVRRTLARWAFHGARAFPGATPQGAARYGYGNIISTEVRTDGMGLLSRALERQAADLGEIARNTGRMANGADAPVLREPPSRANGATR